MSALLDIQGISKRYPGVVALDDVGFTLRSGEIHALMGENGAGKSTLIKTMTGAERPDAGVIRLEGVPLVLKSPSDAQRKGISTVYQEVNLIPTLSVAENIGLGRQPRGRLGMMDWKEMNRRADAALAKLNLRIDVTRRLESHSIAVQQMVAIARALDCSAKVLVLDEPTSSLDAEEVARLFAVMKSLRAQGLGIVFVTHFLDQVYEVSDRITVLRNGRRVGEYEASDLPRLELVAKMMGKELEAVSHRENRSSTHAVKKPSWLRTRKLGKRGSVIDLDLEIAPGEVVGLAGLLGSGRTEAVRLLFGIDRAETGTIEAGGREVRLRNPRDAIRAGFALSPEDRKGQGIIPDLSVRENILLALQARRGWIRILSRKKQEALARKYIAALNIACADSDQPIRTLSGGNQQKVILARWLASDPKFLMLDEPTRGIDVGAKAEIQKLVRSVAADGKAILFISSDLEETVNCADRVAVFRDRRKSGELEGERVRSVEIMKAIAEGIPS